MKIAIIDYGMGNIKSIESALRFLGIKGIVVTHDFNELMSCDKLVLPGVGAFDVAMKNIKEKKLDISIKEVVKLNQTPILGICLGMQLLCASSSEGIKSDGLNLIEGDVVKFDDSLVKVPHVGFNQVIRNKNSKLFTGFEENSDFYFSHSYFLRSSQNITQTYCDYGKTFISSFEVNNIAGVQFHPELSQGNGLKLIKNFIDHF